MAIHCYTSISFSYLNRARVLGESLRRHHPDWILWLLITDHIPPEFDFVAENEPYDHVVFADQLGIEDFQSWIFKHNVIEVCTAVKGPMVKKLFAEGAEKVFYFDPDTAVFSNLDSLVSMFDHSSILLTPHQLRPDYEEEAIIDNEICSLQHGIYNLGFLGVKNDVNGNEFATWWDHRCKNFCYDEKHRGIFVDQKWCDHVPGLFGGVHIIRDPGYNVASWNLGHRKISVGSEGEVLVNGDYPLRFYHFTKLGPVGDSMTRRYAKDNYEVYELWTWYKNEIKGHTDETIPQGWWQFGRYSDGTEVLQLEREIYRHRPDLREAFPDPFKVEGYRQWCYTQGLNEYPELNHLNQAV